MSPLARQDGFYVPEVREAELRRAGEQDEEEDEDDGATIVSGMRWRDVTLSVQLLLSSILCLSVMVYWALV